MKIKSSIYNIIGVLVLYFVKIIFTFAGKTVLIKVMGNEYNGINALFTSIIAMLSIAEMGIGSAIIYNLYKPVKENDKEEIKSIMDFYKVCYEWIAVVVFVLGICILPFIKGLVGSVTISESIYILYFLFLLDTMASYFLSYKRSIFYADQKNYVINICDIGYTIILQLCQILSLVFTHNFIIYLAAGILCRIVENTYIQWLANRNYPFLMEKKINKLSKVVKQDIIEKVKGLLFHKIGSYVVFGTDNMIISKMVSITAEGMYSNYLTIINPITNIISQAVMALQASIGSLLIDGDKEKNYLVYKKIALMNFWLYTLGSVCLFNLIQDFISLWLGEEYKFNIFVVFILSLNFWQTGMRSALGVFKNAAGIYYEDRYVPLIESIINLIASILFTFLWGVIGVFIGTFVSSLLIYGYSYPVFVYKPIFGKSITMYIKEMLVFLLQWAVCFCAAFLVSIWVDNAICVNDIIHFIIKAIILAIVTNLILVLMNNRGDEFRYYKSFIFTKILKH